MWTGTRFTESGHPCAGFACKRSHRLVLCSVGKVSFIRPPPTRRSLSSSHYHWLGRVLLLLTYSKCRVRVLPRARASNPAGWQRRSQKRQAATPAAAWSWNTLHRVFWMGLRSSEAIWVLAATAELQTVAFLFCLTFLKIWLEL